MLYTSLATPYTTWVDILLIFLQQPLKWWCHRFFLLPYMHQHPRHYHHQHEYLWPGALRIDEIVTEGSRMVPCYEGPAEKAPTGNLLLRLWWVLLVTLQMLLTTWLSKLQLARFAFYVVLHLVKVMLIVGFILAGSLAEAMSSWVFCAFGNFFFFFNQGGGVDADLMWV